MRHASSYNQDWQSSMHIWVLSSYEWVLVPMRCLYSGTWPLEVFVPISEVRRARLISLVMKVMLASALVWWYMSWLLLSIQGLHHGARIAMRQTTDAFEVRWSSTKQRTLTHRRAKLMNIIIWTQSADYAANASGLGKTKFSVHSLKTANSCYGNSWEKSLITARWKVGGE